MSVGLSTLMTLQVTVVTAQQDQIGLNILHYHCYGIAGGAVTDVDFCSAVDALYAPLYKPLLNATAEYRGIIAQIVYPSRFVAVFSSANSGIGTAGADPMPKQVCGFISKRTIFAGRNQRGRSYIPFPSQSSNSAPDDIPSAGYMTDLAVLAIQMSALVTVTAAGNTADLRPVIWSPAEEATPKIIEVCRGLDVWATQRRRGDYGRKNVPPI